MKLPKVMDVEDVGIIAQGFAYAVLAAAMLVGLAGAVGLAWTVLRLAGGL